MKRILPLIFILFTEVFYAQKEYNNPGITHTTFRVYSDDGILLSEINYIDGRPSGKYKYYYNDGKLMEEGKWLHGHQVGILKRYDQNGKIVQVFNFDNKGYRVGNQLYYYSSGSIRAKKILDIDNNPVRIIRFSREGKQRSYITL